MSVEQCSENAPRSGGASIRRALFWSIVAAQIIVTAYLVFSEEAIPSATMLAKAGLALLAVVITAQALRLRWPLGLFAVVVVASFLPRFAFEVSGANLRPEQPVLAIVSVVVAYRVLRGYEPLSLTTVDYAALACVSLNFISSAFCSIDPRSTLRWALLQAIAMSPFFIIRILIRETRHLRKGLDILIGISAAEAVYGFVSFVANRLMGTRFGVEIGQYGDFPGVIGTQFEANLFGACCGCALVMSAFMYWKKGGRFYSLTSVANLIGLVVSLARTAIGAVVVIASLWIITVVRSRTISVKRVVKTAAVIALIAAVLLPLSAGLLRTRFSSIDLQNLSSDDTLFNRLFQTAYALDNIQQRPWLGSGTASFQLYFNWNDYLDGYGDAGWISNAPIRILHDTGAVGLAVFSLFLALIVRGMWRARNAADSELRPVVMALGLGALLYAMTFQITEGTMLAFTWIQLGLLSSAIDKSQSQQ